MRHCSKVTVVVATAALLAGSGAIVAGAAVRGPDGQSGSRLPRGSEPVTLDPADFVARVTNPYWPMAPGSRWIYRETDAEGADQRVRVTVTRNRKRILGIPVTVVRDIVSEDGALVEATWDWYAQDAAGNVWYMGEDTAEYESGRVVSTLGSWEAGVDGAQPGIVIPGRPEVGQRYRQEYYAGKAEDQGMVQSLTARATVPFGSFTRLLRTRDTTPLEPRLVENKYYARGIGPVLARDVSGGTGREELVRFRRPR